MRPHTVAKFHGDYVYACMYASCTQQCSYLGWENMALEQENGDRDYESDCRMTAGILPIFNVYNLCYHANFRDFFFEIMFCSQPLGI